MRLLSVSFLALVCTVSVACSTQKQSPDELKERTAEATKDLKENAKAVAQGIKEGLSSKDKQVNLNTASKDDLMSLPGMTSDWAEGIIGARPFYAPSEVVKRRIVPKREYEKIADRITTSGAKPNPGM
ncbi:MAG TPA: helix-hairpin-helix domain-containing protein [Terriglobales bacterium]|nr:helix-hairpin-helix domain-containing protein [Terriglobales bacterium]